MEAKLLGKTKYTEKVVTGDVDRSVCIVPFLSDETVVVGDGKIGFCVPANLNGKSLTAVQASVVTAGTTSGTTDIQVRRRRGASVADMLTTKVTLATATFTAGNGVINTSNDDIATGDLIYPDVDALNAVAPIGLSVTLTFS